MSNLSESRIAALLTPYISPVPEHILAPIGVYLDLLLRWNQRTNLTAVRDSEQLMQRQIGESLFAAQLLTGTETLLDFGSGAGFPGIPLLLAHPNLTVTLAESQGKKASFLREALRILNLKAEVWSSRVEEMPSTRLFDVVAMRAVDATKAMLPLAEVRVQPQGALLRYLSSNEFSNQTPSGWQIDHKLAVPQSTGFVALWKRETANLPAE